MKAKDTRTAPVDSSSSANRPPDGVGIVC
jgi:hypothetical protein